MAEWTSLTKLKNCNFDKRDVKKMLVFKNGFAEIRTLVMHARRVKFEFLPRQTKISAVWNSFVTTFRSVEVQTKGKESRVHAIEWIDGDAKSAIEDARR